MSQLRLGQGRRVEVSAGAKEWVVQVDRGVKRGGLMGRVKESGSGYVLAQLSNSIIGVKDENKKEQKV